MKETYRAIEIKEPGRLALVERAVPAPGAGEVLIAVEACGICGADRADIENAEPAAHRVPGHEVVGKIAALGPGAAARWKIGQRVGVGRFGGPCETCPACRGGRLQLCRNQPVMGSSADGGYAERMIARATGLVSIPDDLSSQEAAPILCAGLTTFNALKRCGAEAGDTIAILGIGGLGHMALQYARKMGFRVVAVGRGVDIKEAAIDLGAHHYVDADRQDAVQVLEELGGAKAILTTVGNSEVVSTLMMGLAPEGTLVLLGIGKEPLGVSMGHVVSGERAVIGSITGSPFENEKTLDFSVLTGVRPKIETMPLERAAEAFEKLKSGDVTFRIVLTMGEHS